MYEVKQAHLARAVDILRAGPMTAAQFAVRMWPDRVVNRTPGQHSKMGNAFLYRIGQLNYVEKVSDLWMIRRYNGGTDGWNGDANGSGSSVGSPTGLPFGLSTGSPVEPTMGSANGSVNGQATELAERTRLLRLVGQATEPVPTVTHDAALGDIRIRSIALDGVLVEACALVVLSGRSSNVYPPCAAPRMIVGLSPAESARGLFLRWSQSGKPPELARESAWITAPDGIVATSGSWRPAGASMGWVDPEDIRARIQRQRVAAGLA